MKYIESSLTSSKMVYSAVMLCFTRLMHFLLFVFVFVLYFCISKMECNEVFQQADGSIRRPTKLNSDLRRPPANLRTINTLQCSSYKKCMWSIFGIVCGLQENMCTQYNAQYTIHWQCTLSTNVLKCTLCRTQVLNCIQIHHVEWMWRGAVYCWWR